MCLRTPAIIATNAHLLMVDIPPNHAFINHRTTMHILFGILIKVKVFHVKMQHANTYGRFTDSH
ncbi:hypothetical protein D3C72_2461080 [compost metagenome]